MYQINVSLSENQARKAQKGPANLRLSRGNLVGSFPLQVGKREFNKWNKAREKGTGVVIQTGGSLLGLAAAAAPMAAKALGLAGLSFGAEKLLGKIFGSGFPPEAVQLAQMVEQLTASQKKMIRNFLKQQGIVSGAGQRGGFLGLLASLGIPLAISLVKKVFGKGFTVAPTSRAQRQAPRGKGMFLEPPPVWGRWGKKSLWTLP